MFNAQKQVCRGGFTLIELLIVIAIIAILALIAIPNFLEAQTRSKVSRAYADMRTMATAVEAYRVDYNTSIFSVCPDPNVPNSKGTLTLAEVQATWTWYSRLTTPVAYLTSIVTDPFSSYVPQSWGGSGKGKNPYHFYSGPDIAYSNSTAYSTYPRSTWVLISLGPNIKLDVTVDGTDADAFILYDRTVQNQGGGSWDGLPYDPTNGTISAGDIYLFNSGAAMPLFKS
ncbi:MAG: prepilin-type N-terminal cleavage/methylation domain-containing protein [Candidatus Sumerlaeota bacterium]|nr:prepilin-type N-terminal cleavage/methylation domain-containing protein [Candidatus Sumerlaeota bacterium]